MSLQLMRGCRSCVSCRTRWPPPSALRRSPRSRRRPCCPRPRGRGDDHRAAQHARGRRPDGRDQRPPADLHFFANNRPKDYSRAGELLHRGYSTPGVRSREDIADRLVLLYRETGRDEEAEALAAEAKRISRSNYGASVRRTIHLEDAGDRAVVRDTATATFEGEGFPLDRMVEIVEALDAARPAIRPRRATKVARNAPGPCGSGRRYKKCCGSGSD